ncbi:MULTISPECIES: ribosome biogenesis GTPase YlqF [Methylomonas]|uniref:Ribosome biogenesis GTPase A n=1 Tax=Methylomonas koyamae TaxID=702114 RepID=A0A177NQF6_9GAMM|nr:MULTISPECIES: ribosome biogenesis GTPase YlqF [Methylomonas]ANE54900.1 ribosome biogenesis GTPase YlqF [Methylomonas sp. DH-1]OAI19270.1 ribosome biogenesis GTPase YlqF [Methylomonas koyamae]WNB74701.1 ribosome biogenesis GTPase YlqF [Methylomonas koyamae]
MQIQWYPGHMHKASKEIKYALPDIDLLIEILDARIPYSSQNPMLARLRGGKPCIRVLNKTDLADPELTKQWQEYLEREQAVKTLAVTTQQPDKIKQIIDLCGKMLPDRTAAGKVIRTMIMGIPNVGKSTIINVLAGRVIAKTGNEPAVTKQQQRINLGKNIVLSDTPGVLWPNVENRHSGYRLAATGAVKDTAFEHADIALYALDYLRRAYPEPLRQRYRLETLPAEAQALLEAIGAKRGCLRAGGIVELDKAAKLLLTELRAGTIGRITLETPDMIAAEMAELAEIRAEKAAEREARRQRS